MNPPPLPKPKPSAAHRCALGSVIAPLIAILVAVTVHVTSASPPPAVLIITGLTCIVLVIVGFVTGILGLTGIRQHGTRGLLGKGIAGVVINGVLLVCFGVAAVAGFNKAIANHKLLQNLNADEQQLRDNARQSFNGKTGITNTDFSLMDKMKSDLDSATPALTGDKAALAKAESHYLEKMRSSMKNYHDAAIELREARILVTSNLTSVTQIESRREVLQNFITASENLKNLITNSEDSIRADLSSMNLSQDTIDRTMADFDRTFLPVRNLRLQICECDDRISHSMGAILNLLETDWGRWHFNSFDQKLYFDDAADREIYSDSFDDIRLASRQQVHLQGELVNLPQ
jgi:hypothetical protein